MPRPGETAGCMQPLSCARDRVLGPMLSCCHCTRTWQELCTLTVAVRSSLVYALAPIAKPPSSPGALCHTLFLWCRMKEGTSRISGERARLIKQQANECAQKHQPSGGLHQGHCRCARGFWRIIAASPHGGAKVRAGARCTSQVAQLRHSSHLLGTSFSFL